MAWWMTIWESFQRVQNLVGKISKRLTIKLIASIRQCRGFESDSRLSCLPIKCYSLEHSVFPVLLILRKQSSCSLGRLIRSNAKFCQSMSVRWKVKSRKRRLRLIWRGCTKRGSMTSLRPTAISLVLKWGQGCGCSISLPIFKASCKRKWTSFQTKMSKRNTSGWLQRRTKWFSSRSLLTTVQFN